MHAVCMHVCMYACMHVCSKYLGVDVCRSINKQQQVEIVGLSGSECAGFFFTTTLMSGTHVNTKTHIIHTYAGIRVQREMCISTYIHTLALPHIQEHILSHAYT